MTPSSIDLRSHRPQIENEQIDQLRQRMFGDAPTYPKVPGYEVELELGKGAFGRVYRAFDPRFQRTVALKVVPYQSPRSLVRIEREAQALARLSHPNVVQVYDKGPAEDGSYFIALEYVEGPNLERWLASAPRSRRDILDKFLQVAEGLAAAHQAGLVHRDLKPANVLVGSDGRVRVLDFGLARALDSRHDSVESIRQSTTTVTTTGRLWSCAEASSQARSEPVVLHAVPSAPRSVDPQGHERCGGADERLRLRLTADGRFVGTPRYAAPEQFDGIADARSDQFGYCVALFEALHRRAPFRLDTHGDPRAQLLGQALTFDTGTRRTPRWLVSLLRRGLAMSPADRHPSMTAIADILRRRIRPRSGGLKSLGLAWFAALGAAGIAGAVALTSTDAITQCRASRDAPPPVWSEHRTRIESQAPELAAELDQWADGWQAARMQVCHHTTAQLQATSDACLDEAQTSFGRLTKWLATAGTTTWADFHAHPGPRPLAGLLETMPDPSRCERNPTPSNVVAVWERLLTARILQSQGAFEAARSNTEQVIDEARVLGHRGLLVAGQYQQLTLDTLERRPRG
ncbi:MAG: serine/threonine protein kinase, partial [Deltaproteobacteria bacterium]|nr:serine/threonine protein kinase [Deltaproteobacteria bacterium]